MNAAASDREAEAANNPSRVRERLEPVPGEDVHVLAVGGRIEFIPVRPARRLRGVLRGLDTTLDRDADDRV